MSYLEWNFFESVSPKKVKRTDDKFQWNFWIITGKVDMLYTSEIIQQKGTFTVS